MTAATPTTTATPAQLFTELEGRFASYAAFEDELVARFNARALDFPTGYGWRDVLSWGIDHGKVIRDGSEITVS
jgi:hypothetical protein